MFNHGVHERFFIKVASSIKLCMSYSYTFLFMKFFNQYFGILWGAIRSFVPLIIKPDDGQGAKKEKSYILAGGEADIKPVISGLLISSCIPIHAPKEKPATQQCFELLFIDCKVIQSACGVR